MPGGQHHQQGAPGPDAVAALLTPVRRYTQARLHDRHAVDDVVQETISRVLARRGALDQDALLPYALVVARNLILQAGRDTATERRHQHLLVDIGEPDRPETAALRGEEEQAVSAALAALPERERLVLVGHVVGEQDTAALASAARSTPGAVAAQLSRARARARVDYLLALRRVEVPTTRCRPVLMALSAGDRRRQNALGAGRHILTCRTCATLSEPLTTRQRVLAGLAPLPVLIAATGWLRELSHVGRAQAGGAAVAATAVVAVATVAVLSVVNGEQDVEAAAPAAPAPAAASIPATDAASSSVEPAAVPMPAASDLQAAVGRVVRVDRALVLSVPADEGFWIRSGPEDRLWVQLSNQSESSVTVRAGQRVSFEGRAVPHRSGFAASVGVDPDDGAAALDASAAHLVLDSEELALD